MPQRGSHVPPPQEVVARLSLTLAAGVLSIVSTACERPHPETTSAALDVVLSEASERVFATLATQPELSLGGANETGPTQFFQIQGIHVDGSDRLWILDGRSRQIRVFGPQGQYDTTMGGAGEGPGEFVSPRLLGATRTGDVVLGDARTGRISVFGEDAGYRTSWSLVQGDEAPPRALLALPDGAVVAQTPRVLNAAALADGQLLTDTARLVRLSGEDQPPRALLSATGMKWIWTGGQQIPVPFSAPPAFTVRDDRILVAEGSEFRVAVYANDTLVGSFGLNRPAQVVTDSDVSEYRTHIEESVPEPARAGFLRALDRPERPDVLPAYGSLLTDTNGRVWARRFAVDAFASSEWDVFDAEGFWLGRVDMPAGFRALQIGERTVVGVWYDELGVEFVHRYPWRATP